MLENEEYKQQRQPKQKRCPFCYTYIRLDATHCTDCKRKVGKIDKYGLAKKPFNYKAYLAALLWFVMLGIYIWKIFITQFLNGSE